MKFQKRVYTSTTQNPLDMGLMLTVIFALSMFLGSIPWRLSHELANSSANNPALQGEAGLWSTLGEKD